MGVDLGIENLGDVELIGQGGFSSVYAASHTLLKRPVAVKVLNTLTKDSERRRFERECEVLGRLSDHPNVVTVHGAGYTSDNHPYLIMELVQGGTLADLLEQRHQVEWVEAVGYLVPVVEALGRAHQESILHRDVKPENILLADDEPRLADFGIAYLRDATGATSTHITASWLHTPPETFDNKRDERSDLYSAASTLYNLIAGQAPFWRATDDSLNPLMARLLYEQPPDLPSELAPAALNGFIQRSLAKDPDQRPQTAAQFVAELNELTEVAVGARMARPQPRPEPLAPTQPASQAFAPPPDVNTRAKTQFTPPATAAGFSAAPGCAPPSPPPPSPPPPSPSPSPPPPSPFIPPAPVGGGISSADGRLSSDRELSGGQRALVVIAALI
ncbi:MAG: serine/threonine protein kinase, partial [Actinomycetia bacterium]|nr:serine/threonine protein kinase [Actinomycetes bacterium]